MLPERFIEMMTAELGGEECRGLCDALERSATVSIRVNPDKGCVPDGARPIPWSRCGYYLDRRPVFTTDPAFHAGAYYVQEPSSQFVGRLVAPAVEECGGDMRLLDLCAAPGGKSTLYASMLGRRGIVVANEINRQRASVLADNVRKWGVGNTAVTCNDPSHFAGFEGWFDVITVDAPCSGEGMFRKTPEARGEWSEGAVGMCAERQLKILRDIWPSLRGGGTLVYSTCTFNRTEDEEVLARLAEWAGEGALAAAPEIEVDPSWGIVTGRIGEWRTFRFFPHRTEGEGFFAAVVRKAEDGGRSRTPKGRRKVMTAPDRRTTEELSHWVRDPQTMRWAAIGDAFYGYFAEHADEVRLLSESLSVIHSGVCMGQIFKGRLKPDHSLAMFPGLDRRAAGAAEVDAATALEYLRRGEVPASDGMAEGINLLLYGELPLGWIKRVGNRTNNLYPNSLRILNF